MKKVFLSLGSKKLEDNIKNFKGIEIIDSERDLDSLKELIKYVDNIDFLVINRLLDNGTEKLLDISRVAQKKNIRIVLLMDDMTSFEEKCLMSSLISLGVYAFILITDINEKEFRDIIDNYPQQFNFDILSEPKVIEKEKIIEKKVEVEKIKEVEIMDNSVISFFSAAPTGKSFLSWNLAHALSEREYETVLINVDKGYSANSFFNIDEDELEVECKPILKEFVLKENLKVYTGPILSEEKISNDEFNELLNSLRINNDIVIVDTNSEVDENTLIALKYSTINVLIFDLDNMHNQFNLNLIDKLNGYINFKKTIAVINNAYRRSKELEYIKEFINKISKDFKDVIIIENAGSKTFDYIHTNTCNYLEDKDKFGGDFENLLNALKAKKKRKGIIQKIFKR